MKTNQVGVNDARDTKTAARIILQQYGELFNAKDKEPELEKREARLLFSKDVIQTAIATLNYGNNDLSFLNNLTEFEWVVKDEAVAEPFYPEFLHLKLADLDHHDSVFILRYADVSGIVAVTVKQEEPREAVSIPSYWTLGKETVGRLQVAGKGYVDLPTYIVDVLKKTYNLDIGHRKNSVNDALASIVESKVDVPKITKEDALALVNGVVAANRYRLLNVAVLEKLNELSGACPELAKAMEIAGVSVISQCDTAVLSQRVEVTYTR